MEHSIAYQPYLDHPHLASAYTHTRTQTDTPILQNLNPFKVIKIDCIGKKITLLQTAIEVQ